MNKIHTPMRRTHRQESAGDRWAGGGFRGDVSRHRSPLRERVGERVLLLATLTLAACARSPEPSYYLLSVEPAPVLTRNLDGVTLGVGPVRIPAYLDRPQLVARDGKHHMQVHDGARWGEPPAEHITRVLAGDLEQRLGGAHLRTWPWRGASAVDCALVIEIGEFIFTSDLTVRLDARWQLEDRDGTPRHAARAAIFEPMSGSGYTDLVAIHSAVLGKLADAISGDLAGRPASVCRNHD